MLFFAFYSVLAFTAICANVKGQGYQPTREEFNAIRKVETGGCADSCSVMVGDQGRSIGCYQIMRGYYDDAKEFDPSLPSYESLTGPDSIANSERVMLAYSNRYTTEKRLGREPTFEDFARNHNGGPNGYKKDATKKYYERVERNLSERKRRATSSDDGEFLGYPTCRQTISDPTITVVAESTEESGSASSTLVVKALVIFLTMLAVALADYNNEV